MKRLIAICLILAAALLAGCVVTPAYRYGGGRAGYYYGSGASASVVYGNGYAYPYYYGGYYDGPWYPYAGGTVYYYDRDGHRYARHEDGHHRSRLATTVRRQYGPRTQYDSRRLAQPRSVDRTPRQRSPRAQSDRRGGSDHPRERGRRDKQHRHF